MEIKLKRISRGKQTIKKSFLAQKNISQKELKIKKVFRYTKHYLKLLTEGRNIKDKIGILLFLPNTFKFLFSYSAYRDFLWSISIKNERGVFFCGKNHVTVHTASSFNEYKIKNYFKLSKGTFIDIGANIGIYSIELGRELDKNGNVISIEADPTTFNFLLENIRLNNLENILPLNVGCFSADKKMPFFVEKTGGGLHSFYKESHHKKEILVPAFKLDTLVKKNNINDIKFIKIDVEGSELEVIRGALKTLDKFHPKIIFECADDEKLDDIIEILEKMNYKVFQLPSIRDFLAH